MDCATSLPGPITMIKPVREVVDLRWSGSLGDAGELFQRRCTQLQCGLGRWGAEERFVRTAGGGMEPAMQVLRSVRR